MPPLSAVTRCRPAVSPPSPPRDASLRRKERRNGARHAGGSQGASACTGWGGAQPLERGTPRCIPVPKR
eukprot:scaffold18776_cov140-Isochrysis_galbana.AAC.4